jgi:hypothetical protein
MRSALDLKRIAAAGGGMILDASKFSTLDLKTIAASAKADIILKNVSAVSTMDLKNIAAVGNGHIVIDMTE